ncbi:hypothetical protein VOLCADRAFT_108388 [Volvox carteri f. nagariensis]|uniref:RGS domain-containing protein n=1 Tax=Volvox carteri f. nagariensis TaxID=3068 RepID=D8UJW3_VOLCA|nr:uncharacterized protein VOLCADRAFT_108388 [Volvox carteri f. nagariensis]EFJ39980.1 hypothetical protein VOLCADRAFT_108388 [Volvox carteri f. nagariensis]|eukprot:XP_002958945.1 hypothetical protein VOLCADRAFT_108388 [Volvox carteri f. nagariensis]
MDRHSQIARQQFQVLLERANKRFVKLRELQTRGDYSWPAAQSLFHKAFDSFSRLWQFQLGNRAALLETGLQRSDLGAIANKIGQLYYNYYLRSGDTGALLESYTFYDAVHTRQYFTTAAGAAPDPAAAARQMRFYARFVVVCLFLNRREEAMQLLQELQASVSSYILQYSSPEAQEWQLVVNEVSSLMAADQFAMPLPRSPGSLEVSYTPPLRCRSNDPAATCAPHRPRLAEAILVSYRPRQVKVAELPLELYRMSQALEWQQEQEQQHRGEDPPRQGGGFVTEVAGARGYPDHHHHHQQQQQGLPPSSDNPGVAVVSPGLPSPTSQLVPPAEDGFAQPPSPPQPPAEGPGDGGAGIDEASQAVAAEAASVSQHQQQQQQQPLSGPSSRCSSAPAPGAPAGRNPHRQLLHRPTAQHLLSALLAVTAGLEQAAAGDQFVLLYISADAAPAPLLTQSSAGAKADAVSAVHAVQRCTGAEEAAGGPGQVATEAMGPVARAATFPLRQLLLCPPAHPAHRSRHSHQFQQLAPPQPQSQPHHQPEAPSEALVPGGPAPGPAPLKQPPRPHAGVDSPAGGGSATGAAIASAADGLLSPGELLAGTRRLLLLVLDSDMGPEFGQLQGSERGFPLLCLAAPPWQVLTQPAANPRTALSTATATTTAATGAGAGAGPASPVDPGRYGSLTAMALSCPAQALCALVGQADPQPQVLQQLQMLLDDTFLQLGREMAEQLAAASPRTGSSPSAAVTASSYPGSVTAASSTSPPAFAVWAPVFEDCLTRRLLLHFAFYSPLLSNGCVSTAAQIAPPYPYPYSQQTTTFRSPVIVVVAVGVPIDCWEVVWKFNLVLLAAALCASSRPGASRSGSLLLEG